QGVARLIEDARTVGAARAQRRRIVGCLLHQLSEVEVSAVGGRVEERTMLESLVEGGRKTCELLAVRGTAQLLCLTAQRAHLSWVSPETGGGRDQELGLLVFLGTERLAGFALQPRDQLLHRLLHGRIARRKRPRRFDVEARVVLRRCEQRAARERR